MEPRISLITLGVHDLARSIAFYCDGLGWSRSSVGGSEVAFLRTGGSVLALYPRDQLAADAHLANDGRGFGGIALAHNVRARDDVDQILQRVADVGGTIICPAEMKAWGGYSGYFADPDGFPWEVCWNPGFPLREDGAIELPE
ncbi:MAG: VOC family protein [Chloroflexota bacterium]